jgi:hypothetical protein
VSEPPGYRYSVERITDRTGPAQVALVRRTEQRGVMGRVRNRTSDEVTVLFSRTFRSMLEDWAERRNDRRQASSLEASVEDSERRGRALEQASAGEELKSILDSVDRRRQ